MPSIIVLVGQFIDEFLKLPAYPCCLKSYDIGWEIVVGKKRGR